jgi:hypothetical protein
LNRRALTLSIPQYSYPSKKITLGCFVRLNPAL